MTCGEALITLLERRGVELVFGIPGVHTLELYRGLARSGIRHVTPRHEQGAAFAADGYARVSGRPGVCILITGPGVTNAATAVASAYHDSQPLMVISSATATPDSGRGRGALHDLPDQRAFMSTITAFSETVESPEQLPGALERAFAVLEGPRPRPVHIGIPTDVLAMAAGEAAGDAETQTAPANGRGQTMPEPDAAELERAVRLLADAREPVILLGGGAIDAGAQALALSALCGAPIATSVNGKGAVPETHPAALGSGLTLEPIFGELERADVVVAAGTELSEVDYYYQERLPRFSGALIRIDTDAGQLHAGRAATVALHGDAAQTLGRLAELLQGARARDGRSDAAGGDGAERAASGGFDRGDVAAQRAERLRAGLRWWPGAESLLAVLDALSEALPSDTIVAADSTQLAYAANIHLPVQMPRSYLAPAGYGTLGPAVPMAIGAKLAAPDRPVACLVGDGGLLFTVAELATAAQLGLGIAVVVWNNHGYGEIRDSMDRAGIPHIGTSASAPDLGALARGLGCHAARVDALEGIGGAIANALGADRPTLIELPAELAG
ncbi:MAG TPA: 5-guanidino-2-oxopentanoate decarboxylase [Solirubrobacteraceae bacterium]|nr:5-guanidino-2-oxopentanoate decarboxylase [Solirubrobacteraceae bacterium]